MFINNNKKNLLLTLAIIIMLSIVMILIIATIITIIINYCIALLCCDRAIKFVCNSPKTDCFRTAEQNASTCKAFNFPALVCIIRLIDLQG